MKRTLALILTLCMALSMFSFPALAAETDVAVLESAPLVETETTTPAETPAAPAPAATGDVAAPAAADETYEEVTFDTAAKVLTYNGVDQTIAEPTTTIDKEYYTLTPVAGQTQKNVGKADAVWTAKLTEAGVDAGYTLGTDPKTQETETTLRVSVTINAAKVSVDVTAEWEQENVMAAPTLTLEDVDVTVNEPLSGAAALETEVKTYIMDHPEVITYTLPGGSDADDIVAYGNDLSAFAGKSGVLNISATLPESMKNWIISSLTVNEQGIQNLSVELSEGTVTADFESSYEYSMKAATTDELKKLVKVDGSDENVNATLYLWTAEAYAEAVKTADGDEAALATALENSSKVMSGNALKSANVGEYVIHVKADNGKSEGTVDKEVEIVPIPSETIASWVKVSNTTFAYDGNSHKPTVAVEPDTDVYDLPETLTLTTHYTIEYQPADASTPTVGGENGNATNGPVKPGTYKAIVTVLECKTAGDDVYREEAVVTKEFTIGASKTDFVVSNYSFTAGFNANGNATLSGIANNLLKGTSDGLGLVGDTFSGFTVENANGDTLTAADYTIAISGYTGPNGEANGTEKFKQTSGTWSITYTVSPTDSTEDFYNDTTFTVTIVVSANPDAGLTAAVASGATIAWPGDTTYNGADKFTEDLAKSLVASNFEVTYDQQRVYQFQIGMTYKAANAEADAEPVDLGTGSTFEMVNAGTYQLYVAFDAKDGKGVQKANVANGSFTVDQFTLTTLKFQNLTMEITENLPETPAVTVDNIYVIDLQGSDTVNALFEDMTFEWEGEPADDAMETAGSTLTVVGTLDSVNYKVGSDNTFKGTMTATGVMDSEIVVTGETEFVYDGTVHTLKATLRGGALSEENAKISETYVKVNADGSETAVNGAKDVGQYIYTAKLLNGGNHAAADVVRNITVTAATPTVEIEVPEKATPVAYDGSEKFTWVSDKVKLTGVNKETLTKALVDISWVDADGNQLYIATDDNGRQSVTTENTGVKVTAPTLPGTYYAKATYSLTDDKGAEKRGVTAIDRNYTSASSELVELTIEAKEASAANVLPYATAAAIGTAEKNTLRYGDTLEGFVLLTVEKGDLTGANAGKLPGSYVITGASTEKAEKVGENQSFKVQFIPEDEGYLPITLGRSAVVDVENALFAEDINFVVNNVSVAYDGKAHYLGENEGEGVTILADKLAFPSDAENVKIQYYYDKWSDDASDFTFTNQGGNTIEIQISAENYDTATAYGYVDIGVVTALLNVEDKTVAYSHEGTPSLDVSLVDAEGNTLVELPASAYTITFHKYTELPNAIPFNTMDNAALHVAKDPYWAKVELRSAGYDNYTVAKTVAYAQYTVTKADLDSALVPSTIDSTTKVYNQNYGANDDLSDLKLVETTSTSEAKTDLKVVKEKKAQTGVTYYTGAWKWVDADQKLTPTSDFTVQFVPTGMGGKETNDYNLPTATVNVVVNPETAELTNDSDVTWTPEEADYGLTLGDITVEGLEDVVVTSIDGELEGTWVWEKGSDFVIPVTDEDGEAYNLIFVANENHTCYDAKIPVTIVINKATPTLEVTNTTMEYNGNPAALNVVTNSDANEASYTFVWRDENGNRITAAPTEVGSYQVTVTIPETANFESVSKTVNFEITYNAHYDGVEGFVTRLYQVALGREPEKDGYEMWVSGMKSGKYDPEYVSFGFIFSKEFTNKNYSNAEFLRVMYSTFMDREPDAAGYNMWLEGLNSGEYTREFVFNGFVKSVEFTHICERYGL